jgi:hypothetical protein
MGGKQPNALRDALVGLLTELTLVRVSFATGNAAASCADPHLNNREWCAVFLNDAWHRFCRRLVILSAIAHTVTLSGTVITPVAGLSSELDVIARLRTMPGPPKPHYWEPRWHDAVEAVRAARFLPVNNATQIAGALGSTPSPAANLNTVRNFIAHRNRGTADKLRPVLATYGVVATPGLSGRLMVDQLLSTTVGTSTLFSTWCDQLETIARASVV